MLYCKNVFFHHPEIQRGTTITACGLSFHNGNTVKLPLYLRRLFLFYIIILRGVFKVTDCFKPLTTLKSKVKQKAILII